MDKEKIEKKVFDTVKYYAFYKLSGQKAHTYQIQAVLPDIQMRGLEDARLLLRMLLKEVESHNASISTKQKLIDKLKYKRGYKKSKLFVGLDVPFSKIEQHFHAHPDTDPYEYYRSPKTPF